MMTPSSMLPVESTLPFPRTQLIGRERECGEIAAMLTRGDVPLITLTGPGGVGKTRLAIQISRDLEPYFSERMAFVELGSIRDAQLVLSTIAQAVGLVALGEQSPRDGLIRFFGQRDFLIAIDNFEQVMPAAAELAELLTRCPGLKLLITSRAPLHISGEHEYPVPPLDLPRKPDVADTRAAAVELFIQRARAVRPDFELSAENAEDIAAICIQLDGVPLSIELAASRVKVLSPAAIRSRLIDRLALLHREGRDVPARLRSMRDAVGWSYDLLNDEERALFRRLSVLPGGCSLECAEALSAQLGGETGLDLLERLTSLADKSLLVQVDQPSGEPRFRMLETVRSYGLEQLVAHDESNLANEALVRWLIERMGDAVRGRWGPTRGNWSALFDAEIDNVRSALDWCLAHEKLDGASQLFLATSWYWHMRGHFREAVSWANRVLALEARIGPSRHLAGVEALAGWHAYQVGEIARVLELVSASQEHMERPADDLFAAYINHFLGMLNELDGNFDEAIRQVELALDYFRREGDRAWQAQALNSLGHTNFERGRIEEARAQFEEALQLARAEDDPYTAGMVLVNLARLARFRGDYRLAQALLVESLQLQWGERNRFGMVGSLRGLGQTCMRTGELETAGFLFGAAEGLRDAVGAPALKLRPRYQQSVDRLRKELGEQRLAALWESGRTMPLAELVEQEIARAAATSSELAPRARPVSLNELTVREREVVQLISAGLSNREIGAALFISERTAQTHVQHILDKLGVSTRTAAAVRATELGLILTT